MFRNGIICFRQSSLFRSSVLFRAHSSNRRPANIMESKIELSKVEPLVNKSNFVKPLRIHYKQNDKNQLWDCVASHDSVQILIYNASIDKVVVVRQFRPAVFRSVLMKGEMDVEKIDQTKLTKKAKELPKGTGFTVELCAGIIDKEGLTTQQIAREEVIEETGFHPPLEALESVLSYRTSVGISGALSHVFFCQVDNSMKKSQGGGIGSEVIDVVELSIPEVKDILYSFDAANGFPHTTPGMRLVMSWFIHEKYPKLKK